MSFKAFKDVDSSYSNSIESYGVSSNEDTGNRVQLTSLCASACSSQCASNCGSKCASACSSKCASACTGLCLGGGSASLTEITKIEDIVI